MAVNNENEKYAYLNRLSTEQLEELLRADIESPESGDASVIFHILEVIEKREKEHPTGRLADVGKAWAEFQQFYNIPEGEGLSLYPAAVETDDPYEHADAPSTQGRSRWSFHSSTWRRVGMIAATAAVFFALLIGAQAAGIDVFGALGRWTDETFHFVSSSGETAQNRTGIEGNPENIEYYHALQAALEDCGITENLAPTWYPEVFEPSQPRIMSTRQSDMINVAFHDESKERFFSIVITLYRSENDLVTYTFEKDSTPVDQYTSGTKTFYILSNLDTITATWSDGRIVEKISGSLTTEEVKAMIDSIGG